MSRMERYEDFHAWKLAHALHKKVCAMTSEPPASLDFKFSNNLRDAADSAERNFPEGFGRFGPGEFARFLDFSRASLLETKNELRVGLERGHFSRNDVREATILANRALGALSALQRYLRSPRAKENAKGIRDRLNAQDPIAKHAVESSTTQDPTDEPTN